MENWICLTGLVMAKGGLYYGITGCIPELTHLLPPMNKMRVMEYLGEK